MLGIEWTGSMQTRISPDFLVAMATMLTHGVGSLTGVIMTPSFCNLSSLSLNLGLSANYGYQILTYDHKLYRIYSVVSWIPDKGSCCPKGCRVISELFHMRSHLLVSFRLWSLTYLSGSMLIVAPQSIWNFIFCLAIISSAYISLASKLLTE